MQANSGSGFDKSKCFNYKGTNFDCLICYMLCKEPQECQGCGTMYCSGCLKNFKETLGFLDCQRCQKVVFQPLSQELKVEYDKIEIICQCGLKYSAGAHLNHMMSCGLKQNSLANCKNFSECGRKQSPILESEGVCDPACLILLKAKTNGQNWEKTYQEVGQILLDYRNNKYFVQPQQIQQQQLPVVVQQPFVSQIKAQSIINNPLLLNFGWDSKKIGGGVVLSNNNKQAYLNEQGYIFKSIVSDQPFMQGIHYWELTMDKRTENEMKIGVAASLNFDINTAFCDQVFGFAYYTTGSLRSGSNSKGDAYGKKFKNEGVLGCCLNMNKGTLSFSYNGQYLGVAYTDNQLTKGPVYTAVALLHNAGLSLSSGLQVPSIFQ